MANFYLKYKSVSEVVKWYLTQESMTCLPSSLQSCAYHGSAETDIVNFAGNLSLEISKIGQEWSFLLKRAKYSSLVLLLGAGGVVVYLLRSGGKSQPPPKKRDRQPRYQPKSFWSWLFEEELVEDFTSDHYFLHSHYFGPSLSIPENLKTVTEPTGEYRTNLPFLQEDVSLNSLIQKTSPKKFLKRPLYDVRQRGKTGQYLERASNPAQICNPCPKCVKGTCRLKKHQVPQHSSSSSSTYSGSPQNRTSQPSTSTPGELDDMDPALLQIFFRQRMDGDGSDEQDVAQMSETPVRFLKTQYRPSHRLYGAWRGAPDGKERLSLSPVSRCSTPSIYADEQFLREGSLDGQFSREESTESDNDVPSLSGCSMSGSMFELVQNAREVRRLIRAASFTSSCSDLSLDLSANDNLGVNTAVELNALCQGITKLIDNCDNLEEDLEGMPQTKLPSSKSSMSGLSQFSEGNIEDGTEMKRDSSIPDLRAIQRTLRNNKGIWKLTNFSTASDREDPLGSRQASIVSDSGSLEWDSPLHSWQEARTKRIPLASYSSNVSESGDEVASFSGSGLDPWEWDDCYYIQSGDETVECHEKLLDHGSWLPDIGTAELDLETELRRRELSGSSAASARSSFERDWIAGRRLPPSGRSSLDRDTRHSSRSSSVSDDVTITAQLSLKPGLCYDQHRSSRSRSGSRPRDLSPRSLDLKSGSFRNRNMSMCSEPGIPEGEESPMNTSISSLDTGIESMNSSVCSVSSSALFTSSVNLSPVKEAGEPPTSPLSPKNVFALSPDNNTVVKRTVSVRGSENSNNPTTSARQLFSDDQLNDNSVVISPDKL